VKYKEKGISLLDALISIVILNIGFLLILSVIPATGVLIKHSENSLLAKQIAQTYIEFYGSPAHWTGDFTTLTNLPGMTYGSNEIVQTRTNGRLSSTTFAWNISATTVVAKELYNLSTTVTWYEASLGKKKRVLKQLMLVTLVANPY